MSREQHKLLYKRSVPLKEHLYVALANGAVGNQYLSQKLKAASESVELYARRLAAESSNYQFVRVAFNDQMHHVAFGVSGPIITEQGRFLLIPAEVVGGRWGVHHVMIFPDLATLEKERSLFIRLDSGCHSGMVFGDTTCECRQQLQKAEEMCIKNGAGMIIHIPEHDGRGWGDYKMANQRLMDECGLDTVAAAEVFYQEENSIDQRTYGESAIILRALGLGRNQSVNLATNNPQKVQAFLDLGISVSGSSSVVAENVNKAAYENLKQKSIKWKHDLRNNPIVKDLSGA